MSDKFYKPSTDRSSHSSVSNESTRKKQDGGSPRDLFIQKHEPEFNTAYDKSWLDGGHEQKQ